MNRRQFLQASAGAAAFFATARRAYPFAQSPQLTKWAQAIRGVTDIPISAPAADSLSGVDLHQVEIVEFSDQLHPLLGPTKLWGYNPLNPLVPAVTQRHLGGIIVAEKDRPVRLRATNKLTTALGAPLAPLVPADQTIPGANLGATRTAIHLHGGLVPWISDGGPYDWFGPSVGPSFQNGAIPGAPNGTPTADYYYPNNQSARMVWYHDHAFGITRTNAYSGIASAYLITDAIEKAAFGGGFPAYLGIPIVFQDKIFVSVNKGNQVVGDLTWSLVARPDVQNTGSLWYPHFYDPALYKLVRAKAVAPPDPSCVPEFFGDTMLVNGTVYPVLTLKPGTHRLRVLNACNARFLNLNLFVADATKDGITLSNKHFPVNLPGPAMTMVAAEAGWLTKPVNFTSPVPFNPVTLTGNLLMGPAERADILITIPATDNGKSYILYNDSPAPFPGGAPITDFYLGNPNNPVQPKPGTGPDTRQILRINVDATSGVAGLPTPVLTGLAPEPALPVTVTPMAPVAALALPTVGQTLNDGAKVAKIRDLTLNEAFDLNGRLMQLLGTATSLNGNGFGRAYTDAVTETVFNGTWEVWRIFNLTEDTHPMHFHLVNVQILQRQPFNMAKFAGVPAFTGPARGPELEELCWKETVKCHPGECITLLMKFDLTNNLPFSVPDSKRTGGHEFVWHCHILEHEEHDMMRPLVVF